MNKLNLVMYCIPSIILSYILSSNFGIEIKIIVVIAGTALGIIGAIIGNWIREFVNPNSYYSTRMGVFQIFWNKLFWLFGPQLIGIGLGATIGTVVAATVFMTPEELNAITAKKDAQVATEKANAAAIIEHNEQEYAERGERQKIANAEKAVAEKAAQDIAIAAQEANSAILQADIDARKAYFNAQRDAFNAQKEEAKAARKAIANEIVEKRESKKIGQQADSSFDDLNQDENDEAIVPEKSVTIEKPSQSTAEIENNPINSESKNINASNTPSEKIAQISPAFDCKKAKSPTEISICANPELATLDVENMKVYKVAKSKNPDASKKILNESVKTKSACGMNVNCIKNAYNSSIKAFSEL